MKKSTRGAFAMVMACAAAVGGASAATASEQPEVPVPLNGLEHALDMDAPEITTGIPVPLPSGSLDGPHYAEDHLLPERMVPRIPVSNSLPSASVVAPMSDVLGEDTVESLGVRAYASDVDASTPSANLDLPVTAPRGDLWGLPAPAVPNAGVEAPSLSAEPATDLGLA
ncbi:hypothetical protein [Streptomyces sp. NPDC002564]|uniref:hypothetical protein n=1 Tax=Streptomyces sp. NPDC002564 TaxID=3364649 RepID=UPI003686CD30